jgi:hypothetical protein
MEVEMVFQTRSGSRLLIDSQECFIAGQELLSLKRIVHYARDQVPLGRTLQIFVNVLMDISVNLYK